MPLFRHLFMIMSCLPFLLDCTRQSNKGTGAIYPCRSNPEQPHCATGGDQTAFGGQSGAGAGGGEKKDPLDDFFEDGDESGGETGGEGGGEDEGLGDKKLEPVEGEDIDGSVADTSESGGLEDETEVKTPEVGAEKSSESLGSETEGSDTNVEAGSAGTKVLKPDEDTVAPVVTGSGTGIQREESPAPSPASESVQTTTDRETSPGAGTAGSGITYESHVKTIIESKCLSCHMPGGAGNTAFNTYDNVALANELILERINSTDRPMPPLSVAEDKKLTAGEKKTFKDWADGGLVKGEPTDTGVIQATPSLELPEVTWHLQRQKNGNLSLKLDSSKIAEFTNIKVTLKKEGSKVAGQFHRKSYAHKIEWAKLVFRVAFEWHQKNCAGDVEVIRGQAEGASPRVVFQCN